MVSFVSMKIKIKQCAKKYKKQDGMIILMSMNIEHEPKFFVPLNNHFRYVGKLKKSPKTLNGGGTSKW